MGSNTASQASRTASARGVAAAVVFFVMLLTALALWTAIPVGWLYIGSKVSETQFPSSGPYAIVAFGILISIVADAWLIGRLNAAYVRLTGTDRLTPMRPNWMRSMSEGSGSTGTTTVVEAVMMGSVMLAGAVFVAWFIFLSGSPLPNR